MNSCDYLCVVWPDPVTRGLLHGSPEHSEDPAAERSVAQCLQRGECPCRGEHLNTGCC